MSSVFCSAVYRSQTLVGEVNINSLWQQTGLFVLSVNTLFLFRAVDADRGIQFCLHNWTIIFIYIYFIYISAILLLFNIFETSIKQYRNKVDVIWLDRKHASEI